MRNIIPLALLVIMSIQLVTSAVAESSTMDEISHLMRGYIVLRTGDWWLQREHPPLIHILASSPLLFLKDAPDPRVWPEWNDPAWRLTGRWPSPLYAKLFSEFPYAPDALLFPARFIVICLTVLCSFLASRWANQQYGWWGGIVVLFWLTFSPNWLANGHLLTTDFIAAATFLVAILAFRRLLAHPCLANYLLAGALLGMTLAAKTSTLIIVPILILLSMLHSLGLRDTQLALPHSLREAFSRLVYGMGQLGLVFVLGLFALWAIYGFNIGPWGVNGPVLPLQVFRQIIVDVFHHNQRGNPAYLLGRRSTLGWWYYFPIVFAIKTPLPTLLAAGWGAWLLVKRKLWSTLAFLALPPAVWFVAAMQSHINIGYRHILPVIPFLVLWIGALGKDLWAAKRRWVGLGALALWLAIGTLRVAPHYLAYFNELIGGPENARFWVSDSSVDWGQDLKFVKQYIDQHHLSNVYLSYFGRFQPAQYGITASSFPATYTADEPTFAPFNPPPGTYIISVNHLTGQTLYPIFHLEAMGWFRTKQPCDRIAYSLFVYCVPPDPNPPQWLSICAAPDPLIEAGLAQRYLGRPDIPVTTFDCHSTWTIPDPTKPGWVILPEGLATTMFPAQQLQAEFVQRTFEGDPLYTLYRYLPPTSSPSPLAPGMCQCLTASTNTP